MDINKLSNQELNKAKDTPTDCLNQNKCFKPSLLAMFKHYNGKFKLMDFVDFYINNQDKVGVQHRINLKNAKGKTPEQKLFTASKYGLKHRREKGQLKLMKGDIEIKVGDGSIIKYGDDILVVGMAPKYKGFSNSNSGEATKLIEELDKKHSGTPQYYESVVKQIQRPSKLRNAILKKYGTNCKICGCEGFIKKDGSFYAETHHMIELNKQAPQTMQSWNVLVLCPLCHKKMHYAADVKSEFLENGWKIFLDGKWKIIRN